MIGLTYLILLNNPLKKKLNKIESETIDIYLLFYKGIN